MDITMDMLERMDAQDVFDVCAWHMLRQGARGCDEGGHCLYRAPGGGRCAVGWLIPDSLYMPALEHRYVRDLATELYGTCFGHRFARFLKRHLDLLDKLQRIHDRHEPQSWPGRLRELAVTFDLDARIVAHRWPAYTTKARAVLLTSQIVVSGINHGREEREEAGEAVAA